MTGWRGGPRGNARPRRRPTDAALRAAFAALWLGVGAQVAASEQPPNLVLIAVDTLRADHVGAYGYARPTTPRIDALARRGVLFERASAPSSWTRPSIGSLFTSRHPSEHGAVSMERSLDPALPTLAEGLRDAGYATLGVSANFVHVSERSGFHRGFDVWKSLSFPVAQGDEEMLLRVGGPKQAVSLRAARGPELNREVLQRLEALRGPPYFLYVHYMEPHSGYTPPEPERTDFASAPDLHAGRPPATSLYLLDLVKGRVEPPDDERQRLIDLYDAEIAAVDAAIGELIDALLSRPGWAENTVIAVVSDHGEEFQEHGGWFHGLHLHRESLAVPLVLFDARRPTAGERRREPVDLLDVPTTLLALAGATPADGMRGRALLASGALAPRDLVAELHPDARFEAHAGPREDRLSLTRWPWKTILRDGTWRVYRLDADRGETHPLAPADSGVPRDLVGRDPEIARLLARGAEAGATAPPDAEALEGLRALGYVE